MQARILKSSDRMPWLVCALGCLLIIATGCSSLSSPKTKPGEAPHFATRKERESWWAGRKHDAAFEPGKGYKLPDVPGHFDARGNAMQPEAVRQASFESASPDTTPINDEAEAVSSSAWYDNLDPVTAATNIKKQFSVQPNMTEGQKRFNEAEALFTEKKYAAAAEKYELAAKLSPDSAIEEDALLMEAESWFFLDKYDDANDAYEALVKKYPSSKYMDKAIQRQFNIARYWQQHHAAAPHWSITANYFDKTRPWFDTYGHAIRTYENIRLNDPTGPLADDAIMAMANAHFLAGRWEDADYNYSLLRSEYPDSEHQFQAHLLGLQCKLRRYQGPDYDGTPLDEAEKLSEQLLKQFPDKINAERNRVEEVREKIARDRALRDWSTAQFYEKTSNYGSAKYYYRQLIAKYPTTKMAEDSRQRIAALEGEPDVPPQTMAWLVNLFPESKKEQRYVAQPLSDTVRR